MQRKIAILLALLLITSGVILPIRSTMAASSGKNLIVNGKNLRYNGPPISIKINGKTIDSDVPPVLINNRTMAPIRIITENLGVGATVKWDNTSKTVHISWKGNSINLPVGKSEATINGKTAKLDTSAMIVNNRTMVPLRFVAEAFSMRVDWNQASHTVSIEKSQQHTDYDVVKHISYDENKNAAVIETGSVHYNTSKLSYPDRIVLDISNALLENPNGNNSISIRNKNIKTIRWSQFDKNTVRIVIDLNGKADYKVEKAADRLYLYIIPDETSPGSGGNGNSNNHVIVVDAGHGGKDPGASSADGLKEKDVNLDIALKLNNLLQNAGYETHMTRTNDSYPENMDRAAMANNLNADIFVSIHSNAFTNNTAVNGTEVLYYPKEQSKELAQCIHDSIMREIGPTDRGIIPRPNLIVLKHTKMPAVIVETAFLTNPNDANKLRNNEFKNKMAKAIFDGIENYFNEGD